MRALRPLVYARKNARPSARSAAIAAAATALALVLGLLAFGQRPAHGGATTVSDVLKVGIVAPQVQFELQLPTQTYTGRYLQQGCGGYC